MAQLWQFVQYLYNGGLDPDSAEPGLLRERRTVSATALLLMPVACTLMVANTLLFDADVENLPILFAVLVLLAALYAQAKFGWSRFTAHLLISLFWFAPTATILQQGLNTSNWAFLIVLCMLGLLLGGRRTGAVWTTIALLTMWLFAGLTMVGVMDVGVRTDRHATAVAISGPLIVLMLYITGATFRGSQVEAERKLTQNITRLADEVETRRQAEEAALSAERAKAVFLATMSHELRTPLNGVMGAAQLLKGTELSREQKDLMQVITSSGELLLDLINNVLDLSKLEAGQLQLEQQPTQLGALVTSVVAPLRLTAQNNQVELTAQLDKDLPLWVMCDPLRVKQILLNLCGNALKFTEQGRIDVIVKRDGQSIKFEVQDTGVGIPADAQDRLFQPFTQADSSTARKYGGTGLGLNIVKQLVESMGGTIAVRSELGRGSTFTVRLPLNECEVGLAKPLREFGDAPAGERRRLKILVTDDNAVNRMVATKMIRRLDHDVVEAEDGEQALAAVRAEQIDLVLMDVQMPNMDGLTATRRIREMPAPLNATPIVGLSANVKASDKDDMLAAGMDEYLAKPVRIEQLDTVLSELAGVVGN